MIYNKSSDPMNIPFSGQQEVIQGVQSFENGNQPRSNIDRLIADLAHRQRLEDAINANVDADDQQAIARQVQSPRGVRLGGLRRVGDVEGIRQSSGNWQRDNTTPWNKPILAKPLNPAFLETQTKQT